MQQCVFNFTRLEFEEYGSLVGLWRAIRFVYFPERPDIDQYAVVWSRRRQKRVLATCNIQSQKVIVAQELNDSIFYEWLSPILYHEMCHAYFGKEVPRENGKRAWHGRQFRLLERRHPRIPELDIWIKTGGWRYAVRRHRGKRRVN
jgi:SprT-like family